MMSRTSPLHLLRLTACSFALAAFAPAFVSAAPAAASSTSPSEGNQSMSTNPRVKLHTNMGDMVITLDAAKATGADTVAEIIFPGASFPNPPSEQETKNLTAAIEEATKLNMPVQVHAVSPMAMVAARAVSCRARVRSQ